ncbi:hypothetical protein JCM19238_3176 [Vibrio ponticus]|nr:hypothetical protein JCM19238_3176 [Vibrio ponticus]
MSSEREAPTTTMAYTLSPYAFYSNQAPSVSFQNLTALAAQYPNTTSVTVEVTQTSTTPPNNSRPLSASFPFSTDEVYELLTVAKPVLRHNTPLHPNDDIGLQNETQVLSDVQDVLNRTNNVDVRYVWQRTSNGGLTWTEVSNESYYADLPAVLSSGNQYRLMLWGKNTTTTVTTDLTSARSTVVLPSTAVNYDIVFDPLATPREGIPLQVVSALQSSGPDTSFDARIVTWTLIAPDGSRGTPIPGDTVTPAVGDAGSHYEVTVEYQRGGSL